MTSRTFRTVVYEPDATAEIERLSIKYQNFDEALCGLEWAFSNKPEIFPLLCGSKLRMATIQSAPRIPEMRIWFTFTSQTVNVIFAEECKEDDD